METVVAIPLATPCRDHRNPYDIHNSRANGRTDNCSALFPIFLALLDATNGQWVLSFFSF